MQWELGGEGDGGALVQDVHGGAVGDEEDGNHHRND